MKKFERAKNVREGRVMSSRGYRLTSGLRWREFFITVTYITFILALMAASQAAMSNPTAYPGGKNLLENGSFERAGKDASDSVPHGWNLSYGTNAEVQTYWFGSYSPFGSKVLQLLDDSNTAVVEVESDYIEIVPGGTYTVEGWIREYAPSTNKAYLYIKTYDANKTFINYVRNGNPSTTGWHKTSKSHRMPGNAVYAKVACRSSSDSWGTGSGRVMRFDGIAFYQSEPGDILFKDAFDLALTEQGCCGANEVPAGWSKYRGTSDPDDVEMLSGSTVTKIALDDHDVTKNIVIRSPYVYVNPGVDYTASVQSWIDPSATNQKGYLYLRFYNRDGVQLSTEYYDASTTLGGYEQVVVGGPAPVDAVRAQILLASSQPGEGRVKMHSVSLTESYDQTRWVSPTGTSSYGTSENDPAKFNDPAFWSDVDSNLDTGNSVHVVFKAATDGAEWDYEVNSDNDDVTLNNIGSATKHLLIEGESAHGVRFVRPGNTASPVDYFIAFLNGTENITLRNFVFQDLQTDSKPSESAECGTSGYNYCISRPIVINSGTSIRIENISMQDLPNSIFGGITPRLGYDDVWIMDSDFIGIGLDHFAHSIYGQWGSDLVLSGNYSEDSLGSHFKLKGEITGCDVVGNEFVSTATGLYHTNGADNHANFVNLNSEQTYLPSEWPMWFGSGYNISGNTFDYRTNDDDNGRTAVSIVHGGCDPSYDVNGNGAIDVGEIRQHLLTQTESNKVNAIYPYDVYDQKAILRNNFKLDFDDPNSIFIGSNTRLNSTNPDYHQWDITLKSTWGAYTDCSGGKVIVTNADLSNIDND